MPGILQNLRSALQRSNQTRTVTDTLRQVSMARRSGSAAAYRRTVSLLLMTQLILWAALPGVAVAGRGVWLSALGLFPVAVAVWLLSRWAWCSREESPGRAVPQKAPSAALRPWELLALLPCCLLDTLWLEQVLLSLLYRLMPSYPQGILRVVIPLLLTLAVLLGRRNGAAYGVSLWRWTLPLLAVWVLAQALGGQGMEQLYPLLGRGWQPAARAMLPGVGSLWVIGLLFLLPGCDTPGISLRRGKPVRTLGYVLPPLALACLMAVTAAACASWQAHGTAGFRLLWVGRTGPTIRSGLWSLVCLLSLMTGLCTTLMAAQKLTQRVWQRCPGWLPVLAVSLPAAALVWVWPEQLPRWLLGLLPWRLALWAVAAAAGGWRKRRAPSIS